MVWRFTTGKSTKEKHKFRKMQTGNYLRRSQASTLNFSRKAFHLFLFDLVTMGGVTKLTIENFFELIVTDALFKKVI